MPKKTKQYGWQCSECDKDPSEPFQTPKEVIDLTAPRYIDLPRPRNQWCGWIQENNSNPVCAEN